jgi:hypothetical protein
MFYGENTALRGISMTSSDTRSYEMQLAAMRTVMEALKPLDEKARESVLAWVESQLGRRRATVREDIGAKQVGPKREGTISVVAQKIGAKSARDLLLAAATHLTLYQGKDKFTRAELVACAKDARNWKSDYSNQMAFNIKRMSDAGDLFEKAKDVFSLSDAALASVEGKLGK